MFCFHWWVTIHQWTDFQYQISTNVQISRVKYIPLLCWIWPDFIQKSSLLYQQSLGMIQTCVSNSQLCSLYRKSSVHSSANYIHHPAKLSVFISLFTIHFNSLFPYFQLTSTVELSVFFVEGRHLSKIQLSANVTPKIYLSFIWSRVLFLSSFTVVVDLSKSTTCLHFHSFIYSKY